MSVDLIQLASYMPDDWWEKESTDSMAEFQQGKTMICTDDGITFVEFDSAETLIWFATDFVSYVQTFGLALIFGVIPGLAIWAYLDHREKKKCQYTATPDALAPEKATQ